MNIEAMAREAGLIYYAAGARGEYTEVLPNITMQQLSRFATIVRAEAMREAAGICGDMHPFDNGVDCGQYILAAIDQPKEK